MVEEKKGLFARLKQGLSKTAQSFSDKVDQLVHNYRELDDEFYDDLCDILILADVGMKTSMDIIEKLKARVRQERTGEPMRARELLKDILTEMMQKDVPPLTTPCVLMVVGVNGAGKTTSIGKLALHYKQEGKNVLLCAADTFRAAASQQLSVWAERAGVPLIKHAEGADPAAVLFDAITAAKARKCDLLIVDTAGRLQNKKHLMEELAKMSRIAAREYPDAMQKSLLVLDATTGQNGLSQALLFAQTAPIQGLVLSKLDSTSKGGIAIAITREMGLPVEWVGVGEGLNDLQPFDAKAFVDAIL